MKKASQNTQPVQSAVIPDEYIATEGGIDHLSDCLDALTYLQGRNILCTKCGYMYAESANQYNRHCASCKNPDQTYNVAKGASDFDRLLCKGVKRYVDTYLKNHG